MSDQPKDGGPAFPLIVPLKFKNGVPVENNVYPGLSLRDWFAGQALAGFLAHPEDTCDPEKSATWAYTIADAMLAARDEEQGT